MLPPLNAKRWIGARARLSLWVGFALLALLFPDFSVLNWGRAPFGSVERPRSARLSRSFNGRRFALVCSAETALAPGWKPTWFRRLFRRLFDGCSTAAVRRLLFDGCCSTAAVR